MLFKILSPRVGAVRDHSHFERLSQSLTKDGPCPRAATELASTPWSD